MCMHAASRQSFKEQEALVYQQLAQLIRDGVWLKSYLAAVMRLQQEAYLVSYPCNAPPCPFVQGTSSGTMTRRGDRAAACWSTVSAVNANFS